MEQDTCPYVVALYSLREGNDERKGVGRGSGRKGEGHTDGGDSIGE